MWYDNLIERDLVPDFLIRIGIRKLLRQRLREEDKGSAEANKKHLLTLVEELKNSPIAVETGSANEQHYEVPTEFYQLCLGKHLKYSGCYYKDGVNDLNTAERDMLELTCERAELKNGMDVLELGCGWGSLSLFMSEKFPESNFTVVSNSKTQKIFIDSEAKKRNINNLTVITADMNSFSTEKKFDRVVSVEMFEHMRNHEQLLQRISRWLKPAGKLFVHIFVHKTFTYLFETKDQNDWMGRYFFTGGMMPGDRYLYGFTEHFNMANHWPVNGTHYGKTAEAWLKRMDSNKPKIMKLFKKTYGEKNATKWWVYWRVFYMACAELWNYKNGQEWWVSHYLLEKK